MDNLPKIDNFWNAPSGKFAKLLNWGILIGGGILFYVFLPAIVIFFNNILHLMFTIIGIAAIGYCFWDEDIRTRLFVWYKGTMKSIAKHIVNMNPILTLETCLQIMKDKLVKISKHITELAGQMRNLDTIIKSKKAEIEKTIELASLAKENHNESQQQSKMRMAMMSQEANNDFILLRNQMDVMVRVLKKMESSCQTIIDETEHNLKVQRDKYEFITKGHKAIKGAMSIMVSSKEKEIFNETMENLQKDMDMKLGEMDRVMDMSKNVIESIDLNNMLMDKKGLEALEKWEQEADFVLLGKPVQQKVIEISENKYGFNL